MSDKKIKGYIEVEEPIKLKPTQCRDDYIDFYTPKYPQCINCNDSCHPNHISITNNDYTIKDFCGFKCIIHYYTKELKKEGKI